MKEDWVKNVWVLILKNPAAARVMLLPKTIGSGETDNEVNFVGSEDDPQLVQLKARVLPGGVGRGTLQRPRAIRERKSSTTAACFMAGIAFINETNFNPTFFSCFDKT